MVESQHVTKRRNFIGANADVAEEEMKKPDRTNNLNITGVGELQQELKGK